MPLPRTIRSSAVGVRLRYPSPVAAAMISANRDHMTPAGPAHPSGPAAASTATTSSGTPGIPATACAPTCRDRVAQPASRPGASAKHRRLGERIGPTACRASTVGPRPAIRPRSATTGRRAGGRTCRRRQRWRDPVQETRRAGRGDPSLPADESARGCPLAARRGVSFGCGPAPVPRSPGAHRSGKFLISRRFSTVMVQPILRKGQRLSEPHLWDTRGCPASRAATRDGHPPGPVRNSCGGRLPYVR